MESVLRQSNLITDGDPYLPKVDNINDPPLFAVVHTNHFTMICRCLLYGVHAPADIAALGLCDGDGRLSIECLRSKDPYFAEYVSNGLKGIRLRKEICQHPHLLSAIVASSNLDLVITETEAQLLERCRKGMHP